MLIFLFCFLAPGVCCCCRHCFFVSSLLLFCFCRISLIHSRIWFFFLSFLLPLSFSSSLSAFLITKCNSTFNYSPPWNLPSLLFPDAYCLIPFCLPPWSYVRSSPDCLLFPHPSLTFSSLSLSLSALQRVSPLPSSPFIACLLETPLAPSFPLLWCFLLRASACEIKIPQRQHSSFTSFTMSMCGAAVWGTGGTGKV